MLEDLIQLLRCPATGNALVLHILESNGNSVTGILAETGGRFFYPVFNSVPVLLPRQIPSLFTQTYQTAFNVLLDKYPELAQQVSDKPIRWSFSDEWNLHFEDELQRTWGFTTDSRVQQFFLETGTSAEWCKGKLILDAGCGNGMLTKALMQLGATIVGIDYSESVFEAQKHHGHEQLLFVRGDLQNPPFAPGTFDLIVSNGVLHHTKNTAFTFGRVSQLVKPQGKFYLWLYRRPVSIHWFLIQLFTDLLRFITCRLPKFLQGVMVNIYTAFSYLGTLFRGNKNNYTFHELRIVAWDAITPLWRHYHTPYDVAFWFFENGFSSPVLTHWDNPHGFGMVAEKIKCEDTAGLNFGNKKVLKRYYDK